jgi:glycine/D-amino acid oxidase-like deaminating enzyme
MAQQNQFDVAVIGGGLVGAAIAWGMRSLGPRLALLDEGDVAYRASRGNFGLVWVQGKGTGLPPYGSWTQLSARRWPELAAALVAETGIDSELVQPGGFHVCLTPRELDARVASLERLLAQPGFERYDVEVLDRAKLAERLPGIGPEVAGATWCAKDGHCNPLRLLYALHAGLGRADCAYRPNHGVSRITPHAGGFDLATPAGTLTARKVVLAAGLGNKALAPMVGLAVPVRPQKGQVIVLERVRPFLSQPLSTIRQTADGSVLIGDSQQELGFDETLGLAVLATMAERAQRIFPLLRDVRVNRTWAALRVMTPDGLPVYEQSAAHPGAFVATCHSGVTLAAAHAYALAPAIVAGTLPDSFTHFSARRFDVPQAA